MYRAVVSDVAVAHAVYSAGRAALNVGVFAIMMIIAVNTGVDLR